MRLIIDCFGADQGPKMVAEAVKKAMKIREFPCTLVGPKQQLEPLLHEYKTQIEWIETEEYIHNEEHPVHALRRKKQASLVLGLQYLNETEGVFLTAGSTGALLAGGYFITRRLPGIERACLGADIPNPYGGTILVDTGANMDTTPEILYQFAHLGSAYVTQAKKIATPKVGLLNVGVESAKGDKRSQETYQRLEQSSLHFVGNVEARSLLDGSCDVIVADGFSGNIALKSLEGTAKTLLGELKKGIYSSWRTKLGGLLLKPVFRDVLSRYNYKEHGGAPLLGVRKPLYKAHGNSDAQTFAKAIHEALAYGEQRVEEKIEQLLEEETHDS